LGIVTQGANRSGSNKGIGLIQEQEQIIGSYRLLNELGSGGMGKIYRAEHLHTRQIVALKTVRLERHKHFTQLRREIDTLSRIRHPGIVSVVEQGIEAGRPWFAMELVTGVTLREYITAAYPEISKWRLGNPIRPEIDPTATNPPPSDLDLEQQLIHPPDLKAAPDLGFSPLQGEDIHNTNAANTQTSTISRGISSTESGVSHQIMASVERTDDDIPLPEQLYQHQGRSLAIVHALCATLAYLHGEGIVHCDLKPENVILQADGWPILIDFGLLSQFAGGVNREVLDMVHFGSGTVPYMSPEQINGELLDARADIYSLGCILYELLVGHPPFIGTRAEILSQCMHKTPQPPSQKAQDIHPIFDHLIERMLAKDRRERIGYADVVGAILEEAEPELQQYASWGSYASFSEQSIPYAKLQLKSLASERTQSSKLSRPQSDLLVNSAAARVDTNIVQLSQTELPNIPERSDNSQASLPIEALSSLYSSSHNIPTPSETNAVKSLSNLMQSVNFIEHLPTLRELKATHKVEKNAHNRERDSDEETLTQIPIIARLSEQQARDPLRTLPLPYVYLYRPALIGRTQYLQFLKQRIEQLRANEKGGLVLVGGESGVGKTRLLLEAAHYARSQKIPIITSRCTDQHAPPLSLFHPVLDSVGDHLREHQQPKTPVFSPSLDDLPDHTQSSWHEIALPAEHNAELLSPSQAHLKIYRSIQRAIRKYTEQSPLILLLDDLQWIDELTLGTLAFLAKPDATERLLIFGAYRNEEKNVSLQLLLAQKSVEHIALPALQPSEIEAIISDMLALANLPSQFMHTLVKYSEGNPYFVAEYLHIAVEEGFLRRDVGGYWQVAPNLLQDICEGGEELMLSLPRSLRALIEKRLAKLPKDARVILAAIAIHGRELPLPVAQNISNLSQRRWSQIIQDLERQRIIEQTERETLDFVNDKFRNAVYTDISETTKATYHYKLAEALEKHFANNIDAHSAMLGYHWEYANQISKATHYYRRAALLAREQHVHDKSIQLYLSYLNLQTETSKQKIEAHLALSELFVFQNQLAQSEHHAHRVIEQAKQLQLPQLEAEGHLQLARLFELQGLFVESRQQCEAALDIYHRIEHIQGEGYVLFKIARDDYRGGLLTKAQRYYREALALHRVSNDFEAQGRIFLDLANIYIEQGKLSEARECCNNTLSILRQKPNRQFECFAIHHLARIQFYQGHTEQAFRVCRRALRLARELGDQTAEALVLGTLATISFEKAQIEQAEYYYAQTITIHRKHDNRLFEAMYLLQMIALQRLTGRNLSLLRDAIEHAEQLMSQLGASFHRAFILCELGHIELLNQCSAQEQLDAALQIVKLADIDPLSPSAIGRAVQRLQAAQQAYSSGQSLLCGEDPQAIPAPILKIIQNL
jgi:serine/threonine protein kinase/tetratricopeptide (TPR) repeat protein